MGAQQIKHFDNRSETTNVKALTQTRTSAPPAVSIWTPRRMASPSLARAHADAEAAQRAAVTEAVARAEAEARACRDEAAAAVVIADALAAVFVHAVAAAVTAAIAAAIAHAVAASVAAAIAAAKMPVHCQTCPRLPNCRFRSASGRAPREAVTCGSRSASP